MALHTFVCAGQEFKMNRRYSPIKKIGEGAYGLVCGAVDEETGDKVAIKRIKPMARDEWEARHTLREITIMRMLDSHPNVVSLRGLSLNPTDDELYIVMELMFSDLYRIIQHVRPLNTGQVKVILKQTLKGLEALHAIGVIHRDLKPGNILLTKECQVKISDFGLARFYRDVRDLRHTTHHEFDDMEVDNQITMTQYVVTRWYRCPELLLGPQNPYSTSVDVWSAGCIFAELLLGKALFPGNSNPEQVRRIFSLMGSPQDDNYGFELHPEAKRFLAKEPFYPGQSLKSAIPTAPDSALDLLQGFLNTDPTERITVRAALDHPYLEDCPPAPGGHVDLQEFMMAWEEKTLNMDFEKKDASLDFLRQLIIEEVDRFNREKKGAVDGSGKVVAREDLAEASPRTVSESSSSSSLSSSHQHHHHSSHASGDRGAVDDMHRAEIKPVVVGSHLNPTAKVVGKSTATHKEVTEPEPSDVKEGRRGSGTAVKGVTDTKMNRLSNFLHGNRGSGSAESKR